MPNSSEMTISQLIAVCIPIMLVQLLGFGSNRGDILIAGAVCPQDELALYGAANRLILFVSLPLNMVNLTVLSSIPELYSQGRIASLQQMLQRTATLAAVPSVVFLVVVLQFPGTIMSLVFGPFYVNAATILIVLASGQFMSSLTGSCHMVLLMTGHQKIELAIVGFSFLGLLVAGPIAAYHYGVLGLAVAWTIVFSLMNITACLAARWLVGVWTNASYSFKLWRPPQSGGQPNRSDD